MKFGIREICNVVFRAKSNVKIGSKTFVKGQPVLYIDTAKTSTMEGAATTVYATGGRGNTRLIAWEGEKTLTFTVEDALLSPIGFSVLSGAGLIKSPATTNVHVHITSSCYMTADGEIDLSNAVKTNETICEDAPIFIMETEEDGSVTGGLIGNKDITHIDTTEKKITIDGITEGKNVMVDFYVDRLGSTVSELQIDAGNFAGFYYVEADTLFRQQSTGEDLPAIITFPNVKIQSNFTFSMASTGDPSTFTFTMDAFPGYTYFDNTRQVLCVIQIVEDSIGTDNTIESVMDHEDDYTTDFKDSARRNPPTIKAAVSIGSSTGITSATINYASATTKPADGAVFTYVDADTTWKLGDDAVTLSTYGIAVTGTPNDNDTITVSVVEVEE